MACLYSREEEKGNQINQNQTKIYCDSGGDK